MTNEFLQLWLIDSKESYAVSKAVFPGCGSKERQHAYLEFTISGSGLGSRVLPRWDTRNRHPISWGWSRNYSAYYLHNEILPRNISCFWFLYDKQGTIFMSGTSHQSFVDRSSLMSSTHHKLVIPSKWHLSHWWLLSAEDGLYTAQVLHKSRPQGSKWQCIFWKRRKRRKTLMKFNVFSWFFSNDKIF